MNILITGGASGLGESITRLLAKEQNNTVYFTYNNSKVKADKINAEFANAIPIKCSFTNQNEVEALKEKIAEIDIDVLINNAYSGEFLKKHFHKIPAEDFLVDFKTNIVPTVEITQKAIAIFRKKKQGKIITILTSALVNTPPIGSAVYIANKSYLEKLTKVWATENANFNITSNSVSPSLMQTNLTASIDERIIESVISSHPLKKILTMDEVADTVLFLVNATNHINGVDLVLNAAANLK